MKNSKYMPKIYYYYYNPKKKTCLFLLSCCRRSSDSCHLFIHFSDSAQQIISDSDNNPQKQII